MVLKGVKHGPCICLQVSTLSGSVAIASSKIDKKNMTMLWPLRFSHMGVRGMQIMSKGDLLCGHQIIYFKIRAHFIFGKLHCNNFSKLIHRTKGTLDYIHSDFWGTYLVESFGVTNILCQ